MVKNILFAVSVLLISCSLLAQVPKKDKSIFKEYKPGFYQNNILKDNTEYEQKLEPVKNIRSIKIDLAGQTLPNKMEQYKPEWHNPPISQGNAGTCWAYSTTSYFESEVYRITKQKIKLSEIFTVYWEYVEKARRFVQERGNSLFSEGSEANAVTRIYKQYGAVNAESYTGLEPGRKFHNHEKMFAEMNAYLKSVKDGNIWNEEEVLSTIKAIMNHYIGMPPVEILYNGKKITPKQYLTDVLKLNMDDYVDILSYMQEPFYQKVEYKVEDNWWHNADYNNVPLDKYMAALKGAIRAGFTVSIGGDVSEAGFETSYQVAIVPTFDIPSEYIDDDARQFRFSNKTTTDDHGMHLVGYIEKDGKDWYLIKDSSAGSRNNDASSKEFGYYFFSEDFVKLKMMDFMVHKDAVKELLKLIK